MKPTLRFVSCWMLLAIAAVLVTWFSACPTVAVAQGTQGQNAVYNSSNGIVGSSSFIDAGMFASVQNPNICALLRSILVSVNYPATGALIDARDIPNSNPATSMTCTTANPSPWAGITNPLPSTILLPAGTIQIPATWIVPSSTRLIGEGESNPTTATPGTTIQAENGFNGPMIQFGSSSFCGSMPPCTGISVERLTLDGNLQSIDGIDNKFSQTNTRVDHVTLYRILGTGLLVSDTTSSSGDLRARRRAVLQY